MTNEEAAVWFEKILAGAKQGLEEHPEEGKRVYGMCKELTEIALSALRPVSRERVEKYRGEWEDIPLNMDSSYFATKYNLRKKCTACKYAMPREWPNFKFCPACGSPMTDEAMEMAMERLEALWCE